MHNKIRTIESYPQHMLFVKQVPRFATQLHVSACTENAMGYRISSLAHCFTWIVFEIEIKCFCEVGYERLTKIVIYFMLHTIMKYSVLNVRAYFVRRHCEVLLSTYEDKHPKYNFH